MLCTDPEKMDDNLDYMTFPERRGYRTAGDEGSSKRYLVIRELADHDWYSTLEMLQEWLYFGLLRCVFDDAFRRSDFIDLQPGHWPVICSRSLPALIRCTQSLSRGWDWAAESELIWCQHRRIVTRHISAKIDHAVRQLDDLELGLRDERTLIAPFPELCLSLHILAQSLRITLIPIYRPMQGEFWIVQRTWPAPIARHFLYPSLLPIHRHLTVDRGWCPNQALYVCNTLTYLTLYYVSCIRRNKCSADHSFCANSPPHSCVAQNISAGFRGRHTQQECTCRPLGASNPEMMFEILKDGGIPVVMATQARTGEIKLQYVRSFLGLDYTAVSHLWSDGLGDPSHNHLPACQLMKLLGCMIALPSKRRWNRGYKTPQLPQDWHTHGHSRYLKKPLYFWLDVYCVPLGKVDEVTDTLKRKAISRMVPTYAFAKTVLVLDRGLQHIRSSTEAVTMAAQIFLSRRRGRFWIHQELSLASHTVFQFSGRALSAQELFRKRSGPRGSHETLINIVTNEVVEHASVDRPDSRSRAA